MTEEIGKSSTKHRLQLDVTSSTLLDIDALKTRTGSSTRAETIRRALRAYAILLEILPSSSSIAALDDKGKIKREVPSNVFR